MSDTTTALRQLIMSFRVTQLLSVTARLGLADRLQHGPQTADELAQSLAVDARALGRMLRALASLGIFSEEAGGTYALTPLSELLLSDAPGSLHSIAVLYGEEWLWQAYSQTIHSVRTGRPAFNEIHGESLYSFLENNPTASARFHQAMVGFSGEEASAIVAAYDFSDAVKVVDVGGGHGALLTAVLRAHPHLSGIVFDRPAVVESAKRVLGEAGMADRSSCIGGDFRESIPAGGDVYLLKSILHNWDDSVAIHILKTCRRAISHNGRLLVGERVISPVKASTEAKLFDFNMLVMTGGQERTEKEYGALLRAAGFDLKKTIPTSSALTLIEGVPR